MKDHEALYVWFEDFPVGQLWRTPAGSIGFRYSPDWVRYSDYPISQSLPITTEEYSTDNNIAHRFFANLLPEGGAREQIVRDLKIANTDFDLLRAIGGECAGGFYILPEEREPSDEQNYRQLRESELTRMVARPGHVFAALPQEQRPRVSLAGAQNKFPVLFQNDRYYLPECEVLTTHILKFQTTDYRLLPAYETFTSHLAQQIGLPVINIELKSAGKHTYSRSERYDRYLDKSGFVMRLNQEDFCQALGYGHEKKYQDDGGPSFSQCLELLRQVSSDPAIDTLCLLRWQIFNVLAGNSDGHAKNLSLLYLSNGDVRLAPFYDLICTRAMERIDHRLAFAVGGQRDPGLVTRGHWETLAEECDIGSRFLHGLVEETASSLLEQIGPARARFETLYGDFPSLQRIERVVKRQCRRVVQSR